MISGGKSTAPENEALAAVLLACFDGLALQKLAEPGDFDIDATYHALTKMAQGWSKRSEQPPLFASYWSYEQLIRDEEASVETKKVGANETRWSETTALTVRRVVHASVLLDFGEAAGGAKILADPRFSEKDGFLAYRWGEPLGVPLGDLPRLAGVVSSHGHYVHYDVEVFSAYQEKRSRSP